MKAHALDPAHPQRRERPHSFSSLPQLLSTEAWEQLSNSAAVEDRETVLKMLAFPTNMLEGLAGMCNQNLLDRSIVKTRVEGEAKDFWATAGSWIEDLRTQFAMPVILDR